MALADEKAYNASLENLSPSSAPPAFQPTIVTDPPSYSAPRLKLTNVQQRAKRGVIDFSSLDYSSFPVVNPGTSLSIRGEIGFSYNLSFTCENALPVTLDPIHVFMHIGQCEAGKSRRLSRWLPVVSTFRHLFVQSTELVVWGALFFFSNYLQAKP